MFPHSRAIRAVQVPGVQEPQGDCILVGIYVADRKGLLPGPGPDDLGKTQPVIGGGEFVVVFVFDFWPV